MFIAALVCTGGSVILQDSTGVLQASSPHPHSIIPPTHPTSLTPPLPHPSPALSEVQHAHSARRPSPNLSVHATGDTGCVSAMGGMKQVGSLEGFQTASLLALNLAGSSTAQHAPVAAVAAAAAAHVPADAAPPRAAISLSGAPNPDTPACESARGTTY